MHDTDARTRPKTEKPPLPPALDQASVPPPPAATSYGLEPCFREARTLFIKARDLGPNGHIEEEIVIRDDRLVRFANDTVTPIRVRPRGLPPIAGGDGVSF